MKCNNCIWAIWENYYGVVGCMACDEECPTDEDVKTAKEEGYLAYYGCSEEDALNFKEGIVC